MPRSKRTRTIASQFLFTAPITANTEQAARRAVKRYVARVEDADPDAVYAELCEYLFGVA
jgi:predicted LPLAT superfamily acyltransferase